MSSLQCKYLLIVESLEFEISPFCIHIIVGYHIYHIIISMAKIGKWMVYICLHFED